MSMRFPFLPSRTRNAVLSLGGRWVRPRPIVAVTLKHGPAAFVLDALLDTGADDTVFPDFVAGKSGLDLSNAPTGEASGIGLTTVQLRYAEVSLRISDGVEQREWQAWVGFTALALRRPLLGFAGFLQFFTATFHGDLEHVELAVNRLYTGS